MNLFLLVISFSHSNKFVAHHWVHYTSAVISNKETDKELNTYDYNAHTWQVRQNEVSQKQGLNEVVLQRQISAGCYYVPGPAQLVPHQA